MNTKLLQYYDAIGHMLNGHAIDVRDKNGEWGTWDLTRPPDYERYEEFRKHIRRVRVAEMTYDFTRVATSETYADILSSDPTFVKWITDWIEY